MVVYRIWIDAIEFCHATPSLAEARRRFKRTIAEYPNEVVNWDRIDDPNATVESALSGDYDGAPVRMAQCNPD